MKIRATLFLTINRKTSDKKKTYSLIYWLSLWYSCCITILIKESGNAWNSLDYLIKTSSGSIKALIPSNDKKVFGLPRTLWRILLIFHNNRGYKKSRCLNLYLKRHNSIWKTNKINLLKASFAAFRLYFIIIILVIALKALNTLGFFLFWTLIKYN